MPIFTPSNATNQTLTWTSSDPNVASVEDGEVTAKAKGTATITATSANGKTATCEVEVVILPSIELTFYGYYIAFRVTAQSMTVDWGDDRIEEYSNLNQSNVSHYTINAEYTVRIYAEGLSYFKCDYSSIRTLDVSNCTALTVLICYGNQLNTLDISKNTALTELQCGVNQLSSLDLSKNTALEELNCNSNQLSSLDLSKNTALKILYCNSNQLISLDISNNTALEGLSCFDNQLDATALNAVFTALPDRTGMSRGLLVIGNNPGRDTCNTGIITPKNWYILP
jgi:Leucine-rich repeat (LRR) protein